VLCALGSALLYVTVNPLTMWLTFATFVGYAVIYTVVLKPRTPQNIVIGGASGAMPPVLGWAAMRGDVGPEALVLFLIIFLWTPPHFWALALYRVEDYRKSGLPMLPVTHGSEFTRLQILLYTLVLWAACLLPFAIGMSSWLYLAAALVLSAGFTWYGVRLWRDYSDALARKTFRFSLIHLSVLFAALLLDHYLLVRYPPPPGPRHALGLLNRRRTGGLRLQKEAAVLRRRPHRGRLREGLLLPDTDGKTRTLQDFRGKAVVVFFGYTQCPDVCPTTMAEIAQAKKLLGPTATRCRRCSSPSIPSATRRSC
jgi:hypothetical protein